MAAVAVKVHLRVNAVICKPVRALFIVISCKILESLKVIESDPIDCWGCLSDGLLVNNGM
jgi:hypothetical protein